ncbi:hypothetical protein ACKFKF_13300 [Phormidesmis sp. 146-12]
MTNPLEYPEFTQIYNYIDNFLKTYPNETDFWEILNKNLVSDLLTKLIPTTFGFDYQLADVLDRSLLKSMFCRVLQTFQSCDRAL